MPSSLDSGASTQGEADRAQWVDALLPPELPPSIDRLVGRAFADGKSEFRLGPADQLLAALILHLLRSPADGRHLVLALPRGRHDVSILCGFLAQLIRAQAWKESGGRDSAAFTGPVVVVGRDTAVQQRLSRVRLRGTSLRDNMAGAVSACRVRADGRIVEADGTLTSYEGGGSRLLYLNSRVGWPALDAIDGFGVIDRTTLANDQAYQTAIQWVRKRCSRSLTLADLADPDVEHLVENSGLTPMTLHVTSALLADLHHILGGGKGASPMTTNGLLDWSPEIDIHRVSAPELDRALRTGYGALAAARSVGTKYPSAVRIASRLLTAVSSCVVDIGDYGKAVSEDPWLYSPRSMARTLERRTPNFSGPWRSFGTTDAAKLRTAALAAYAELQRHNPKREALLDAIDLVRRRTPAARILIRTPNRVAKRVLLEELSAAAVLDGRMDVAAWSERKGWRENQIEIWPALPPWSHRPLLHSAEAQKYILLAYDGEVRALSMIVSIISDRWTERIRATSEWLGIPTPTHVWSLPVDFGEAPAPSSAESVSLEVDFDRIVARATEVIDAVGEDRLKSTVGQQSELVELIPVELTDGSIWWLAENDAVGVLIRGSYKHRLVGDLQIGDLVVVPRGEGREELFSRLVEALHGTDDVRDLEFMLARFRRACKAIYEDADKNWAEAQRRLNQAGAAATSQLKQWASGDTIAPAEATDVQVVARLAKDTDLESGWQRISAIASEVRGLHIRLGKVISRALAEAIDGSGSHVDEVTSALGSEAAAEILDEFVVCEIAHVGKPESVASDRHGAVLHKRGSDA